MKLLLHACCGPCACYPTKMLRSQDVDFTLLYYNPNIHPYKEYEARRDCLKEYSKMMNLEAVFDDEYGLDEFCEKVINNTSSRCV